MPIFVCFRPVKVIFFFLFSKIFKDLPDPVHPNQKKPIIFRNDPFAKLFLRLKVLGKSPTQRHAKFLCSKPYAPRPPCTSSKKWICTVVNQKFYIRQCPKKSKSKESGQKKSKECKCKPKGPKANPTISPKGICFALSDCVFFIYRHKTCFYSCLVNEKQTRCSVEKNEYMISFYKEPFLQRAFKELLLPNIKR